MGSVFCNAYVPSISTKQNAGKISGYGYAFGYLGGLLALGFGLIAIALPDQPMFGISIEDGENFRSMNVLVAIWFTLFSIPTFLWLSKDKRKKKVNLSLIRDSFMQIKTTFRDIKEIKNTVRFLIARLFYNDALITIFSFGGIIAAGVYGFNLEEAATNEQFLAADAKWNAYLDENGFSNGLLMRWLPGSGSGINNPYDYLQVFVSPSFKEWGSDVDKLVTGAGAYSASLYGELASCDTPRIYRSTYVGGYNPE